MKRRDFIQKTAAGSAILMSGLPLSSFATEINAVKRITILHTNDTHSHIDPLPMDDPRNPNMGGAARRATLVNAIRKENPNTLLLDAGDIFQGTPYFNYYGGELEFKIMSMLQYDLATLGNHDFDNGIEGFYKQLPHAKFDFVSANYGFKNSVLDGIVKPYKAFVKDGIKIGIFGLGIQLQGLVDPRLYKEVQYNDPIGVAQDMSRTLKEEEKCDLIICLSHLGFSYGKKSDKVSDQVIARNTKDIDLIIGGHTHTFLSKPYIAQNANGNDVLINQVGCYGINVGQIDFYFEKGRKSFESKTINVG
ncbi:bifunctional metallophosphatase/5'-nucleotidase [Flavobacterium litorale]|uniref:Metallophosphatase n=1 Tax=Flavobacterium litorale TaxID=2856519 RepID=A0ABX8V5E2_9FLAO|nr:metallophosphatase [Flavobacterium litorale]QYJ68059.1 metallophosphatase [Flavobacterium litorale]